MVIVRGVTFLLPTGYRMEKVQLNGKKMKPLKNRTCSCLSYLCKIGI